MIFSSLLFIYAFFPVSLFLFCVTPKKFRQYAMLVISTVFCAFQGLGFLTFMIGYTLWNYLMGIICEAAGKKKAISMLTASFGVISDIIILLVLREQIFMELSLLNFIVPVGISFTTLTAIGYLLDVRSGRINAERNILKFALYMLFFPKLPMGPLISYSRFKSRIKFNVKLDEIGTGITLFIKGLTKKVVFADNIYMLYSAVKSIEVSELTALSAWLGVLSYILCLYFTLSGFSDMGAGLSRCFGVNLPQSFYYPILSMEMRDYCARWHIPVVRWFRQYIVMPVTSKSRREALGCVMLVIMWGIIGLWYDFRINMLIWGVLIGIALITEKMVQKKKALKATAAFYTLITTSVCSVFFFGDNVVYSLKYLVALIGGNNGIADSASLYLLKMYIVLLLIAAYLSTDLFRNLIERSKKKWLNYLINAASPIVIMCLLIICTAKMSYTGVSDMMLPILEGAVI